MINKPFIRTSLIVRAVFAAAAALLTACGGGGGGAGEVVPPPPPPDVIVSYDVTLDAASVTHGSDESGTAEAVLRHNETEARIEITVTLSGVSATSVSLRRAFAGNRGDEVYALQQGATADEWMLSAQPFTGNDADQLQNGAMYLLVTTSARPDGALRGQILSQGVEVHRIAMSPEQVSVGSSSTGSGSTWVTVNHTAAELTVHAQLENLSTADGGTLRHALAGDDGPVLETLVIDPALASHWQIDTVAASTDLLTALADGELYVEFTTPGFPAGAVRGQHVPEGMEVVMTDVRDDIVVLSTAVGPRAGTVGRLMTTIDNDNATMTAILNLFDVPGAATVELRQAPAGQNGPAVAVLEQDMNVVERWRLSAYPIDATLQANLDNRTLYVSVATVTAAEVARGQLETASSAEPADASLFTVTLTDPQDAAVLDSLPATIFATLNREPLPASVTAEAVVLQMSGADGSFSDGNEIPLVPASVTANGNTIEISLAGVSAVDDVYRLSLPGGGGNGIVDLSGIALDGNGDGQPGGTFESSFEVRTPLIAATLSDIQEQIFTPSCATAGCHSGSNPPDGLLLTAGDTWSNTVNVDAVQMSLKRIAPGDPDNSYLVRKIEGNNIVASRMPLGAAALPQDQIDLIRQWVLDGAADN